MLFFRIITPLLLLFLANCADYLQLKNNKAPDFKLSTPSMPKWSNGDLLAENANRKIATNGWIAEFDDEKISLIAKAVIANNQDLKAAAANVEAASASAQKAGASLKPNIDLNLSDQTKGNFDKSDITKSFGASIDISWEADIWGRLSANKAKAKADFEVSKADYEAARESLVAQAVKAYLYAIEAYQQREAAQMVKESYAKDLKIVTAFYNAGSKTKQDVFIATADLAESEANLASAVKNYTEAVRNLELLLGQYPSGQYAVPHILPKEPDNLAAGIPSDILEQRPDLIAAERKVASAFDATTMARAAKLPRISLTSSIGGSSDDLNTISDPTNLFWNLASNLLVPLFDAGKLQSDVKIADANQKSAIAGYQAAALAAFNDVETALSNEETTRQRIELLQLNYDQSKQAYEFVNSKYLQGEGNILDVDQLKRNMITAEKDLITARQQLLAERVNLYLALGISAF